MQNRSWRGKILLSMVVILLGGWLLPSWLGSLSRGTVATVGAGDGAGSLASAVGAEFAPLLKYSEASRSQPGANKVLNDPCVDGYKVLVVYGTSAQSTRIQAALLAQGISQVDLFSSGQATPTLAQLQAYDLVLVHNNVDHADPVTLGNRLAAYQDGGGLVFAFNYTWGAVAQLQGVWMTAGYSPFNAPGANEYSIHQLGGFTVGHLLMQGVTTLNDFYTTNLVVADGATQVAAWSNGKPLLAFKGNAFGISGYVGDVVGGGGMEILPGLF